MQRDIPVIGRDPVPNAIIHVKRLALETVVQEGRVQGARVAAMRGTFACTPQVLPMHQSVDIICTTGNYVYAIRGAALTGLKLGVDETGSPMVEGYWIGGTYTSEFMRPAAGAE